MVDKINREAKQALGASITVLEHAMELALQKEDLDAMIAIADRLMMLYQYLSDKNPKKFKMGFTTDSRGKEQDGEDDDESD